MRQGIVTAHVLVDGALIPGLYASRDNYDDLMSLARESYPTAQIESYVVYSDDQMLRPVKPGKYYGDGTPKTGEPRMPRTAAEWEIATMF